MGSHNSKKSQNTQSILLPARHSIPSLTDGRSSISEVNLISEDLSEILDAVSRVLLNMIIDNYTEPVSPISQSLFDEHFLKKRWFSNIQRQPCDFLPIFSSYQTELCLAYKFPEAKDIYDFVMRILSYMNIHHECVVIMLIYILRMHATSNAQLRVESWRSILLGTLILATKVSEDSCILNMDFLLVYKFFNPRAVRTLEGLCANSMRWQLFVPPQQYAHYYHQLKQIALSNLISVENLII